MQGGWKKGVCKVLHIMSNAPSSYKCDLKQGCGSRPPAFRPARLVAGSTPGRRSAGAGCYFNTSLAMVPSCMFEVPS